MTANCAHKTVAIHGYFLTHGPVLRPSAQHGGTDKSIHSRDWPLHACRQVLLCNAMGCLHIRHLMNAVNIITTQTSARAPLLRKEEAIMRQSPSCSQQ